MHNEDFLVVFFLHALPARVVIGVVVSIKALLTTMILIAVHHTNKLLDENKDSHEICSIRK